METESVPLLVTAWSGIPSPLKSPLATARGREAVGFSEIVVNSGLPCAAAKVLKTSRALKTLAQGVCLRQSDKVASFLFVSRTTVVSLSGFRLAPPFASRISSPSPRL